MRVTVLMRKNRFPEISRTLPQAAKDITSEELDRIIAIADPLTPVLTGELKRNKRKTASSVIWDQPYAGYVNFGTIHMAPRLFATTAINQVRPEWIRKLSDLEGRL